MKTNNVSAIPPLLRPAVSCHYTSFLGPGRWALTADSCGGAGASNCLRNSHGVALECGPDADGWPTKPK